jgi:riboflavin kinase/FMN adenylyltransferase
METRGKRGAVITVGTFDGVHRGHQEILRRVDEIARAAGLERVVYSFRSPPRFLLNGVEEGLLLPESVKVCLLERRVERVERANFSKVGKITAEQFVCGVLIKGLAARAIVVGERFRFGRGRRGDLSLLRRIGETEGVRIVAVPPLMIDGAPVSSTRIRSLLREGRIDAAAALLGRPPLLVGRVIHGDRLGRELGYPTANLAIAPEILRPAKGAYLAYAFWDGMGSAGLLYIGDRPTLDKSALRCEIHLFSPPKTDLYGLRLEVQILARLRGDQAFPSLAALRRQIDRDAAQGRALLLARNEPPQPILP